MITYCPPITQPTPEIPAEVRCLTFTSIERFSRWAQENGVNIPCWRWP
jgi:hypothetical protein